MLQKRISDLKTALLVNDGDLFPIEQAVGTRSITYTLLRETLAAEIATGATIEFNNNGIALQWRYVGEVGWHTLITLSSLKGEAGKALMWKGTWIDTTIYRVLDSVSYYGSSYVCLTDNSGKNPGSLANRTYWGVVAQRGTDGAAASIALGTVTTLAPEASATITNTGTSSAAVFNFGLPRGAQGLKGDKGDAGAAAINIRGVWSSATTYVLNDAVTFNGSFYILTNIGTWVLGLDPTNSCWTSYVAKGDAGTPGTNGSSITWRGTYTAGTYVLNDVVEYNGSAYIVSIPSTTNAPSNLADWDLVSSKGADGKSIVWQGVYSAVTTYQINDAVSYLGSSYICKEVSLDHIPTNTEFWDLMSEKGVDNGAEVGGVVWDATATYKQGDLVTTAQRDSVWICIQNDNTDHDPTASPLWWQPAPADAVSLQLYPISVTPPTNGQVLTFNSTSGKWEPAAAGGGGGGGTSLYASSIADGVLSGALGGATSEAASVWKTRTLSQVFDLLLFPTQYPTYTIPTLVLSGTQSGTKEVGVSITQALTLTATKNDAGAFTTLTIKKNGANVSTSSSLTAVAVGAIASQFGYADPNNPNASYTITYSETVAVPYSSITWSASSVYSAGLAKKDNKNISDTRAFAVRSAGAPQSGASDLTASTVIVTGIYPYYWGKRAATSGKPTAAQIAGFIQAGTANKVLTDASGTITITFDASSEYVWVAHEASLTNKTKWYNTALNQGNIGAGQFIEAPVQYNVTSSQGYWTGISFDIYISGSATNTSGSYQLQN
jgi:hypothetical protein